MTFDRDAWKRQVQEDAETFTPAESDLIDAAEVSDAAQRSLIAVTTAIYVTKKLTNAAETHAEALIKAAEASDRQAKQLVVATWALVGATVGLLLTTAWTVFK